MSPKMNHFKQWQNVSNEYAKLVAKCLFCENFAECLIDGQYILFVTNDNICVEMTFAIVNWFTQEYNVR